MTSDTEATAVSAILTGLTDPKTGLRDDDAVDGAWATLARAAAEAAAAVAPRETSYPAARGRGEPLVGRRG